jgi:hypothetical protein
MVTFFSKVDINKHGKIGSQMPAWTMTTLVEELREGIDRKERALEAGTIPSDDIMKTKENLKREKERYESIVSGRPELSETDENMLLKSYKTLGSEIGNSMFTRSDMKMGLADAHEEVRRMKDPIIGVNKDIAGLCEENGISVSKKNGANYVSRDGATKIWKIIGKYFGEPSNVESLRRDKVKSR